MAAVSSSSPPVAATPLTTGGTLHKALAAELALMALRAWLAAPSSDVEKALSKAMRSRHADLNQATRADIASRVLGIAVLRGRLTHLLEREVGPGAGADAALLHALFIARERRGGVDGVDGGGNDSSAVVDGSCESRGGVEDGGDISAAVAAASRAPLFRADESPSDAERLSATWSLPAWLAGRWVAELGPSTAFELGRAMALPGRVTLRTNTLKSTRHELLSAIGAHGVQALPTAESPWGIWLPDGRPPGGGVWQLPGWSEGLFEVQDEGSQLIALATEANEGEFVVDYCAGRGGKTWALASLVGRTGSVRVWDIDPELRRQLRGGRAMRAGAADIVQAPDERPSAGDGVAADVVLVDAPCSSCGALRRHPSQRWALGEAEVAKLAALQQTILEEAATLVRPGGRLVYATCSLLQEENDAVADAFEASPVGADFDTWPFGQEFQRPARVATASHRRMLMPHVEGTDGFFMARWRRRVPSGTAMTARAGDASSGCGSSNCIADGDQRVRCVDVTVADTNGGRRGGSDTTNIDAQGVDCTPARVGGE
eukprot:TRINITY_DN18629_c0_g1_i1.p1 TRINITY_DN18629_c0_g1~~TRINITY_DN18629_c0_g1_i1.p1  ORF type:complete len:560 (-),score=117.13 TRINITY_DN18629_c0_g1_i1:62-1699(-)